VGSGRGRVGGGAVVLARGGPTPGRSAGLPGRAPDERIATLLPTSAAATAAAASTASIFRFGMPELPRRWAGARRHLRRRGARARPALTAESRRHDGVAAPNASPAHGRTTSAAGFLAHGSNGFARPSQSFSPVAAGREPSPFTVAGTAADSNCVPF